MAVSFLWRPMIAARRTKQPLASVPVRVQRYTRAWQTPYGSRAAISAAGSEAGAPLPPTAGGGGALPQRGFKKIERRLRPTDLNMHSYSKKRRKEFDSSPTARVLLIYQPPSFKWAAKVLTALRLSS